MQNFRQWDVRRTANEASTRRGCRDRGSFTRGIGEMDAVQEVRLCPSDIPGAELSKPYQVHTVSALRWWLLISFRKMPRTNAAVRRKCSPHEVGIRVTKVLSCLVL